MSDRPFYLIQPLLPSPLVAAAIHNGHDLRSTLLKRVKLTEAQRRYEEDAYTELFTHICATRIVVGRSQFEVDLNRARGEAVYQRPEDAWGLEIWKGPLPRSEVEASLGIYDDFYRDVTGLLDGVIARHGAFVVFDITRTTIAAMVRKRLRSPRKGTRTSTSEPPASTARSGAACSTPR